MQHLSQKIGVQEDILVLASLFFLNISLCHLWRFIVDPFKRTLFSLIGGVVFLYLMLEHWSSYVILSAVVMHQLINSQKKNHFWVSTILGFGFLMVVHVYRAIYDHLSWKMDCSVMQMFLTTKIIYYGKYLQDTKNRKSLLDFLSYALFFPSVLIGPTFDYETFEKFIKLEGEYKNIQYKGISKYIFQGIFWALLTVFVASRFPYNWLNTSTFYQSSSFIVKILIISGVGIMYRIKFYTGWSFTQAAINASGINYEEKGVDKVDCGSFKYQLEHNPRIKTLHWNTSVSRWINACFYQPLTTKYPKSKLLPILASFGSSALWHGIYPSYFFGFIHWGFLNEVSRFCYKASYLVERYQNTLVYKVLVWLSTNLILNYVGLMIVVLGYSNMMNYLFGLYWSGTIVIVGMYVFFTLNPRIMGRKKSSETD